MKLIEASVLVASLFMSGGEARKRLMQDETDLYLQSPLVEEGDYYCIFENENNSWCISTDSPMLNAGWTYSQKFDKVSVTLADKTS